MIFLSKQFIKIQKMKDIYVSAYNPEYPTLGSRGYIQTILHILPSYLLVFIFIKNFKLKMILIISYVIIIVGLLLFFENDTEYS